MLNRKNLELKLPQSYFANAAEFNLAAAFIIQTILDDIYKFMTAIYEKVDQEKSSESKSHQMVTSPRWSAGTAVNWAVEVSVYLYYHHIHKIFSIFHVISPLQYQRFPRGGVFPVIRRVL